jgi:hypothetical protein
MGAPSYVFTIARVAALRGEPKELLQDIAMDQGPEDGCLSVLDLDDVSTVAFTPKGIEYSKSSCHVDFLGGLGKLDGVLLDNVAGPFGGQRFAARRYKSLSPTCTRI